MAEEKQNLQESIKQSLIEYRDSRAKRREAFGPDLVDTIGDIGKNTFDAAKDKVTEIRDKIGENVEGAKNGVKSFFTNLKDKISEYSSNAVDSVKNGINSARESISSVFDKTKELFGRKKQDFVEGIQEGVSDFRLGLAGKLDSVVNSLRSGLGADGLKADPNSSEVETDEKKQVKVKDQENASNDVKNLSPEDTADFIKYYVQNRSTVREAIDQLDAQKEPVPTLGDYMLASGFQTFNEEMTKDESLTSQQGDQNNPMVSEIHQLMSMVDQVINEKQDGQEKTGDLSKTKQEYLQLMEDMKIETDPAKQKELSEQYETVYAPMNLTITPDDWKEFWEKKNEAAQEAPKEQEAQNAEGQKTEHQDVIITDDDLSEFKTNNHSMQM